MRLGVGLGVDLAAGFSVSPGVGRGFVCVSEKDVADFIINETVNDNLSLCLNADYGQERLGGSTGPLAIWKGIDLYERYSLSPKSAVALREEVYSDPYGYTTGVFAPKTTLSEVTVTYEYHVFDPLMVRCEFRDDFSNVAGAFNTASATPSFSAKSQPTLLIGVVATF